VTERLEMRTSGEVEVVDVTDRVQSAVSGSGLTSGIACVFNPGSTGALTTIEYEPGLVRDLPDALERLFSKGIVYKHDETWHDGNGHSHIRASMIGPSITVPFVDGRLTLGTWQQIIFVELDNKPHNRSLVVQMIGD
jgi:secondary thiamine-phosphate synthase enzyme